jgi:peptide/nickel transport system substrate-binding protein
MKSTRIMLVVLLMVVIVQPVFGETYEHLRGGQVVLRGTGVNNLIPGFEAHMGEYDITRLVYDAPFQWIGVGEYRPQLGETWEMLENNTIIRMTLRDDIHWYDGTPITADDVYFSWHWWNEMEDRGPSFGDIVEKIVVVDQRTFEFHLTRPRPTFFDEIARQSILPKHLYQDIDPADWDGHPWLVNPPMEGVSGPFVIEEHVPNERVVLRRNENWHGRPAAGDDWPSKLPDWPETALLDRIIFLNVPDDDTARLMFEKGEIDIFTAAPKDVDRFLDEAETGKWQVKAVGHRGYSSIMLNHRNPALADLRVRKALSHAIDFDLLLDVAFGGKATRALLATAPQMWVNHHEAIRERLVVYDYDVDEARRLLKEAGYENGLKFTLKMYSTADTLMPETLQYMWNEVGIDVQLELVERNTLLSQAADGDYEMILFNWSTGGFPSVTSWTSKTEDDILSGWEVGYVNARLFELQEIIDATVDQEEQVKYWAEGLEIWTRDIPVLNLTHGKTYWFWSPKLGGVDPTETDYTVPGPSWYIIK